MDTKAKAARGELVYEEHSNCEVPDSVTNIPKSEEALVEIADLHSLYRC